MTQKTIKALYKQPVNYKLIRDGYKTTNGVIQAQDGMPKVVDLSVPSELYTTDLQYNVDVDVNGAPVITTSEFTLPDDQTCEAKKYCYAPKGTDYNYIIKQQVDTKYLDTTSYTLIGTPTRDNGIISNFSSDNYLRLNEVFNPGNNTWEIASKIYTTSSTEQGIFGNTSGDLYKTFIIGIYKSPLNFAIALTSNGSSWDIANTRGTHTVVLNKWYWIKLKFTGSSYEFYYSEDGINWVLDINIQSSASLLNSNTNNVLGYNNYGSPYPFIGNIDLFETYIKIDNEYWFKPWKIETATEDVVVQIPGILDSSVVTDNWQQNQEYKLYQLKNQNNTDSLQLTENSITDTTQKYKQYINQLTIPARDYKWYYHSIETGVYDNYNVFGNPTIDTETGIVSGFSTSNYLQLPEAFNPGNNPWEMVIKIRTVSDLQAWQEIFHSSVAPNNSGRYGISVIVDSGNFELDISTDGSSWIGSDHGTFVLSENTDYWVKIGWNSNEYYLEYSTNGVDYIRDITYTVSNNLPNLTNSWIGIYRNSDYMYPMLGSIDLSESYIKINGNLWWSPMSRSTEAKWLANKSIYDYSATGLYADTLDFTKSYVGVNDSEYHKYVNPKVCLMPIDGGENVTTYALNAITVGNISFDSSTGIVNNFSANDYLKLSSVFNPGSTSWEMVFKIKTPSSNSGATNQPIFETAKDANDAGRYGFQIVVVDGQKLMIQMSSDGSSWAGGWISSEILSYNTNYWIKADYDGTTYRFYYSTDGLTYTMLDEETISGLYEQPVISCIGMGFGAMDSGFTGEIDLSQSYIKINDQIWWQGVTISEIKEHQYILGNKILSGCLYNYDDDGSEHQFDVYYDSNYTQPILVPAGQTYSEGTKVDTITILAHRTWDYQAGGNWSPIS